MVKNKVSSRVHMKSTKPGHRNINCYRALPKDPSEFHKTVLISIILKTGLSNAGVNNKCLGPIFTLFVAVQIALYTGASTAKLSCARPETYCCEVFKTQLR